LKRKEKSSRGPALEIEEAIGSGGRLRVLKFLVKNPTSEPSLTVSRLKTLTGLRRGNVGRHLETLVKWGWVEEISIDGGKKCKLRTERPEVGALIKFFKEVGYV